MVNYIDNYENLITNIPKSLFDKVRGGRNFTIKICSGIYKINEIRNAYQEKDVQIADLIALFGTHGFLEIAMNRGKASSLLGMERDSAVDIYFEETKTNTAANTLF